MIWDKGGYNPEIEISKGVRREIIGRDEGDRVAGEGLRDGLLKFTLYGKKLRGSFALIRTAGFKGKISWLLIKHRDDHAQAGYDAKNYDFSAVTHRSIAQIANDSDLGPATNIKR